MKLNKYSYCWKEFFNIHTRFTKPQEQVSNILKRLNRQYNYSIDVGCGNGRNLVLLKGVSQQVYAIDTYKHPSLNTDGIIFYQLCLSELACLHIKFDLILCTGVLHHLTKPDCLKSIRYLASRLTPNGVMIANVHSKKDYRYLKGREICKDTYLCIEGNEKGQVHCFFDKNELKQYLKQNILSVKFEIFESNMKDGYCSIYFCLQK